MARTIAIIEDDALLRELDISTLAINPKKNGWAVHKYTGNVVFTINDNLQENLKEYALEAEDTGSTICQINLYVQNTDDTGTVSFEYLGNPITIQNAEKIDYTKMNQFLILRNPFGGATIDEVLQIYAMEPFTKNTTL